MCLSSVSGYKPLVNPPQSLGNLLLDITLFCSISFRCRFLFFLIFRVTVRLGSVIGLGLGLGFGNLKHI